ncbi:MAG: accessory factor UbiK family protein [Pseudomonadota bacterium]|nr:accessory factor UbiK family protein [Pseudomonadota bacterium]MEC8996335.1 accessory factor UbiK family protein [Pseudomonadota bacterium]MED5274604.1 accessory factor UbiK family protein [Pseudomonadota bacterium]MED5429945.1 accessory factor UbiK family protein [Pseudomonadota bacterium]|tara:strand:- start:183 stop:410 length:228 start_codon:yes stop_codon:yes gene_type:complete
MLNSDKLIELVEKINSLIPEGSPSLKEEMKNNIKILLEDYLKKLNLVTKEEFDTQKEVLLKTRLKIEELENKLKD